MSSQRDQPERRGGFRLPGGIGSRRDNSEEDSQSSSPLSRLNPFARRQQEEGGGPEQPPRPGGPSTGRGGSDRPQDQGGGLLSGIRARLPFGGGREQEQGGTAPRSTSASGSGRPAGTSPERRDAGQQQEGGLLGGIRSRLPFGGGRGQAEQEQPRGGAGPSPRPAGPGAAAPSGGTPRPGGAGAPPGQPPLPRPGGPAGPGGAGSPPRSGGFPSSGASSPLGQSPSSRPGGPGGFSSSGGPGSLPGGPRLGGPAGGGSPGRPGPGSPIRSGGWQDQEFEEEEGEEEELDRQASPFGAPRPSPLGGPGGPPRPGGLPGASPPGARPGGFGGPSSGFGRPGGALEDEEEEEEEAGLFGKPGGLPGSPPGGVRPGAPGGLGAPRPGAPSGPSGAGGPPGAPRPGLPGTTGGPSGAGGPPGAPRPGLPGTTGGPSGAGGPPGAPRPGLPGTTGGPSGAGGPPGAPRPGLPGTTGGPSGAGGPPGAPRPGAPGGGPASPARPPGGIGGPSSPGGPSGGPAGGTGGARPGLPGSGPASPARPGGMPGGISGSPSRPGGLPGGSPASPRPAGAGATMPGGIGASAPAAPAIPSRPGTGPAARPGAPPGRAAVSPTKGRRGKAQAAKAPDTEPLLSLDTKLDIIGVALIIVSLITLFSFLSQNPGSLTRVWLRLIFGSFGWGGYLIPIALGGIGVWLIWRHFGTQLPRVEPTRIIGIAILFLGLLTFMHAILAAMQPTGPVYIDPRLADPATPGYTPTLVWEKAVACPANPQALIDQGWVLQNARLSSYDIARCGHGGGYIGAFLQVQLYNLVGGPAVFVIALVALIGGTMLAAKMTLKEALQYAGQGYGRLRGKGAAPAAPTAFQRTEKGEFVAVQREGEAEASGRRAAVPAAPPAPSTGAPAPTAPAAAPSSRAGVLPQPVSPGRPSVVTGRGPGETGTPAPAPSPASSTAPGGQPPATPGGPTPTPRPPLPGGTLPSPVAPPRPGTGTAPSAPVPGGWPPASAGLPGQPEEQAKPAFPAPSPTGTGGLPRPPQGPPGALGARPADLPKPAGPGAPSPLPGQSPTPPPAMGGLPVAPRPSTGVVPASSPAGEATGDLEDEEEEEGEPIGLGGSQKDQAAPSMPATSVPPAGGLPGRGAGLPGVTPSPSPSAPRPAPTAPSTSRPGAERTFGPIPPPSIGGPRPVPKPVSPIRPGPLEKEEDIQFDDLEHDIDADEKAPLSSGRAEASAKGKQEDKLDHQEENSADTEDKLPQPEASDAREARPTGAGPSLPLPRPAVGKPPLPVAGPQVGAAPALVSPAAPAARAGTAPAVPPRSEAKPAPDVSAPPAGGGTVPSQPPKVEQTVPEKTKPQWVLPDPDKILELAVVKTISDEELRQRAEIIEQTLSSFGAPGRVVEVNHGPVITQFGVEPDYIDGRAGKRIKVKVGKISALADDLALALAAPSIRIEAPVPGKGYVGIEVPNAEPSIVGLRDVINTPEFRNLKSPLKLALGQDVSGHPIVADLTAMPHLLIAGTTGSGKSVCVNGIICTLLMTCTPEELKLIMVDPKRVELTNYNGIPHLMAPVVTELERIVGVLKWVQREMDDRYRRFAMAGARNIGDFNDRVERGLLKESKLPYIVVIVDELADLMMLAPDETERVITRLAQMARATGIHIIISTQRPSVDVVTGLIKANFPARIAFAVATGVDSRVILDMPGAEKLLGRGDMLFQAPDEPMPIRMQGVFVSDREIQKIVDHWRGQASQLGIAPSVAHLSSDLPSSAPARQSVPDFYVAQPASQRALFVEDEDEDGDGVDDLFDEAVELVRGMEKASISLLQRHLRIGYTRAARLIDLMEERGVIGPHEGGSKPRMVLGPDGEALSNNLEGEEEEGEEAEEVSSNEKEKPAPESSPDA
jgi:S-DNA-T family DNA segregation ATPase FtsK/SpoIIIE